MAEKACELCGQLECECSSKHLDEDFIHEEPTPDDGGEPESEPEPEEEDDAPQPEEKVDDWMKRAQEQGWVPDHVREKHAREAQTLREQVDKLRKVVDAARRQEPEVDPNEGVTRGELDEVVRSLKDRAILSEQLLKMEVDDYDVVIQDHLIPFIDKQPWLEDYLYNQRNPARSAYEFACGLRDGKKIKAEVTDGGFSLKIESEGEVEKPEPKRTDKNRPPVAALEQAAKQPKSIDSVPAAKSTEAAQMSVEDFWNLPSDTLLRIRAKNPEMYEKMRDDFRAKYGE